LSSLGVLLNFVQERHLREGHATETSKMKEMNDDRDGQCT
jgi:hypothetical protein